MSKILALIVGVSNYPAKEQSDLPYCKNDIDLVAETLENGLKANAININICGKDGTVKKNDVLVALSNFIKVSKPEDIFIFYFSGHGRTTPTGHCLLLSDGEISTQSIINQFEALPSKSKVIILDTCMAGNFIVGETPSFDIDETVEEFSGKGYAVFASSSANQESYKHPDKPISLFTYFLCEAIKNEQLIRKGQKSLNDIKNLLYLFLRNWNKKHFIYEQTPIFRAKMGGTIFFDIEEYCPFCTCSFSEETDSYIVCSVESLHNINPKKYAVKVILKKPFSLEEIAKINYKIIEKVKSLDIYKNEESKKYWQGHSANIVFCYYGQNETDVRNSNYLYKTTWVDDTQNKGWWYKLNKNDEIINGIHFQIYSNYDVLKTFIVENMAPNDVLFRKTRTIISQLITAAQKVIDLYTEYQNQTKSESDLIIDLAPSIKIIEENYFSESLLDIPSNELHDWSQAYSSLAGTIYDFALFYNAQYISSRTPENRMACMDIAIERYYKDLEAIKKIEREGGLPQ